MNVLVTGATGFLGSHIADALLERGDKARCLARETSSLRWLEGKPVELVRGSLDGGPCPALLEALKETDCVIHAAGAVMGLGREDYFRANAGCTRNLLAALERSGSRASRFLLVSSLAAAGPGEGSAPVDERQARPVSWYGESKLEAERIAMRAGGRIPVTVIRPPPVYGPRDTGMLDLFRAIKRGLVVSFRRRTLSNFVYVSDAVRGILLAAGSEASAGQIINIGGAENLPADDAMQRIAAAAGRKTRTVGIPLLLAHAAAFLSEARSRITGRPSMLNRQKMTELVQPNWAIDIEKARGMLGYEPQVGLEEGGRITYKWYEERGWL